MILFRAISYICILFQTIALFVRIICWKRNEKWTKTINSQKENDRRHFSMFICSRYIFKMHFVHLTKSVTVHDGHIIQWQCTKLSFLAAFTFDGDAICTVSQPQIEPRIMLCQVTNWMPFDFIVFFRYDNNVETCFNIIWRCLSDPVEQFQALASCVDVRRYKAGFVTSTSVRYIHRCVVTTPNWKKTVYQFTAFMENDIIIGTL